MDDKQIQALMICVNCRFAGPGYTEEDFVCRRRSPIIAEDRWPGRRWPSVRDEDWCGDWEAKPGFQITTPPLQT